MAALYLHHTLFSANSNANERAPDEEQQAFTPHYRKRSITTMDSSASSSTAHGPMMVSASPPYHHQESREPLTTSSQTIPQMIAAPRPAIQLGASSNTDTPTPPPAAPGHILLGDPISMEELRWERDNYHKRQIWKWKRWTLILHLIITAWAVYCTIRYWIAFSVYYEDAIRRKFALSLGVITSLALAMLVFYKLLDYLPQERNAFQTGKWILLALGSGFLLVPAIINNALVPFWRRPSSSSDTASSSPSADRHTLQGRCNFDIDIIWSGTGQQCGLGESISYGAFLTGATVRTIGTAMFLTMLLFATRRYRLATLRPRRIASSSSMMSGTRLMGSQRGGGNGNGGVGHTGESKSTLHASTSRLSSTSAVPSIDAHVHSQYQPQQHQQQPITKVFTNTMAATTTPTTTPTQTQKQTRQKLSRSRSPSRTPRSSSAGGGGLIIGSPLSATSTITSGSGSVTPLASSSPSVAPSNLIYTPYNPNLSSSVNRGPQQPLDAVPETTELDVGIGMGMNRMNSAGSRNSGGQSPFQFQFGKTSVLGGQRWPDDPNVETPTMTPSHEGAPMLMTTDPSKANLGVTTTTTTSPGAGRSSTEEGGGSSSQTHVGYFPYVYGPDGEEDDDEFDEEEEDRRLQAMAHDFRSLVRSVTNDSNSSGSLSGGGVGGGRRLSDEQRRALLHYQAMGLSGSTSPSAPTFSSSSSLDPPLWEREVEHVGGVVRRMSTIESLGSREFSAAGSEYGGPGGPAGGSTVIGGVPIRKSPSPISLFGGVSSPYNHQQQREQQMQQYQQYSNVQFNGGQFPPRPPSRAGTIGTASTGGTAGTGGSAGSVGNVSKRSRGTGDSANTANTGSRSGTGGSGTGSRRGSGPNAPGTP